MPLALWTDLEARRQERYERRKIATQKAAAVKAEEEEALRRKMEAGKAKPPEKLTRRGVHSRGSVIWCQVSAGSGGSQGFPASAPEMASSVLTPWAAAESR